MPDISITAKKSHQKSPNNLQHIVVVKTPPPQQHKAYQRHQPINEDPPYIQNNYRDSYLRIGSKKAIEDIKPFHTTFTSTTTSSSFVAANSIILANAFYMFATIILLIIIIAAISFGIREYYLSFKNRLNSSTSEVTRLYNWNDLKHVTDRGGGGGDGGGDNKEGDGNTDGRLMQQQLQQQKILNHQQQIAMNGIGSNQNRNLAEAITSGLTQFGDDKNNTENSPGWEDSQNSNITESSNNSGTSSYTKNSHSRFNLVSHRQGNITGFSDKSISKLTNSQIKYKITYSIEELQRYNRTLDWDDDSLLRLSQIKKTKYKLSMSKLLLSNNTNIQIPISQFDQAWKLTRVIFEIKNSIINSQCPVEKSLAVLQLISIGKCQNLVRGNPNTYLESFNDCMEEIIDNGSIFIVFNEINPNLQLQLVEVILTYCWNHYRYYDYQDEKPQSSTHIILTQFKKWNLKQPIIQTRTTIFRILCNLQLGLYSIQSTPAKLLSEIELKIALVIREAIKHSICNDYIGYIPMLAQAVDVTNLTRNKIFFFEILKILISNHCQCCMEHYIHDSNVELKSVVQFGLYNDSEFVVAKANEILEILIKNDPKIAGWRIETEEGGGGGNESSIFSLTSEYAEGFFTAPLYKKQEQKLQQKQKGKVSNQKQTRSKNNQAFNSQNNNDTHTSSRSSGSLPHSWNFGVVTSHLNLITEEDEEEAEDEDEDQHDTEDATDVETEEEMDLGIYDVSVKPSSTIDLNKSSGDSRRIPGFR
ncbi:uncharacterized protein J8A68_000838 [[Candida] subhashii]|uniref:Uncharacterized protein n=1 Tax=[Candida] subhashii TaxID=561895 RepID=A0A8J5QVR7_9ASCO|nr:uncharacterized protein J8A68_000838 [[Candida] subhashii]KAG7665632.1 hypothetical protein J8A68_000838 [[Candida] subhashii]